MEIEKRQNQIHFAEIFFSNGIGENQLPEKKANLGYGLVDNIRRMDLEKIEYELKEIHPYLKAL